MTFNKWLDTLVEEKGLDTEMTFEVHGQEWGWNLIPLGAVVEYLKHCDPGTKAAFKTKAVQIDFANGDLVPFFKHLAKALAQ